MYTLLIVVTLTLALDDTIRNLIKGGDIQAPQPSKAPRISCTIQVVPMEG